jgi:hypothetical protein
MIVFLNGLFSVCAAIGFVVVCLVVIAVAELLIDAVRDWAFWRARR